MDVLTRFKNMDKRTKYAFVGAGVCGLLLLFTRRASAATSNAPATSNFVEFFSNFSPAAWAYSTAAALGVPAERFYGVMAAESGGKPYSDVGAVVIRFEPHVFHRRTNPPATVLLPGMSAPTGAEGRSRRGGQAAEWAAFQEAWAINPEAAAASTSYGVGQVMGFNFDVGGYASAVDMYKDMIANPLAQYNVFVNFIRNKPRVYAALAAGDYPAFVRWYNGEPLGSAKNDAYVRRMLDAQGKFLAGRVA